jgi:hypothetical protein
MTRLNAQFQAVQFERGTDFIDRVQRSRGAYWDELVTRS